MAETYRTPDVALAGFASDMGGTKAVFLRDACAASGQAMLRLDYAGHGKSGGRFIDGCIGDWTADAGHIIAAACGEADLVLVGSSMGGWIALLLALRFGARVQGMVLVAPAPDFTETLMLPALTAMQRELLERQGVIYQDSDYGDPTPITAKLLEDGANHLLLNGPVGITCPVRILHGMRDPDVPWQHSLRLLDCLDAEDVRVNFIKDGDHRLSRPGDLALLAETLAGVLA
jgi:pimeloyl-ACP methyl ester carboxylesterase